MSKLARTRGKQIRLGAFTPYFSPLSIVRESLTYPYMDFRKSTDIHMDIHAFWKSLFNYPCMSGYTHWYPSRAMQGHSAMDICKCPWIDIYVFVDISLQSFMLLWIFIWIYMDFYGYPCMDLLWIQAMSVVEPCVINIRILFLIEKLLYVFWYYNSNFLLVTQIYGS